MPIIVSRTGTLISAPELTQAQREDALFAIFCAYADAHPEEIRRAAEELEMLETPRQ